VTVTVAVTVTVPPCGKAGKGTRRAYGVALREAKELIVSLDCFELERL
jgi:hypothetical protein